jgi:hypothetical protein
MQSSGDLVSRRLAPTSAKRLPTDRYHDPSGAPAATAYENTRLRFSEPLIKVGKMMVLHDANPLDYFSEIE